MRHRWKDVVTHNFSYKVVSLLIALILWLTILGRRDFSMSKTIDIELIAGTHQIVTLQSPESVKVKVTGPRTALKKFMETGMSQLLSIDISRKGVGDIEIDVPFRQIDVPFGVKIISIKPSVIKAHVVPKE